ncbi:unnamed protein product [Didymodactylos carnosus]|uniref:Uncharacterized protein n=1 Tax=Didymodactylos carnosus TaxID=1234261 RepID=A0A815QH76_9BILA|nr:unnamed protein product [Didymodactylos carnosus]CAF1462410.1 unnamed protein product [Didymodactylos carnosus]CAF3828952.1 unnamed protein product [Didymodactylos carnosus]CAF4332355.1 unnamed protein product [Didymodactylos carnosus]
MSTFPMHSFTSCVQSEVPSVDHLTSFTSNGPRHRSYIVNHDTHSNKSVDVEDQEPKKPWSLCSLTLNEWLTLLCAALLPVAIAVYGVIQANEDQKIAEANRNTDLNLAEDRRVYDLNVASNMRQQTVYDQYISFMFELEKNGFLGPEKNPWAYANARFRSAFQELDSLRRSWTLEFLRQQRLIGVVDQLFNPQQKRAEDKDNTRSIAEHVIKLNGLKLENIDLR